MKTVKVRFSIATNYINSEWYEDLEFQFDEDATEDEIEQSINESYSEWLFEKNRGGWGILD